MRNRTSLAHGDLDVLSASIYDDTIAWYENDGAAAFTERPISTAAVGAQSVFAADVDGDGDLDVLSASLRNFDNEVAWHENDGSQVFTKRTISTTASGAESVFAADVDGDGDLDVLSSSFYDNKIAWYEQLASPPRVVAVTVRGSASTHAPYSLPAGSGEQLRTVPVGGVNRFAIQFDQNVAVASGDLTISGTAVTNYGIVGFSYDSTNFVATWTIGAPTS